MLNHRIIPALATLLAAAAILVPRHVQAQAGAPAEQKELVAVMELDAVGASKIQAGALTDRLREELLATKRYRIVERAQMDKLLAEQALQQTGCTSQECAVQVGKVLGVRKMISGKASKIEDDLWLISCTLLDVETAETVKAVSLQHEGTFRSVLADGAAKLVAKLTEGVAAPKPVSKTGEALLEVTNVPPDAEVFLNGASKGRGSQRFEKLLPGQYEIVVKRKGYRVWRESPTLEAGGSEQLEYSAERYKFAVFPFRRNGTWPGNEPISHTINWVAPRVRTAMSLAGAEIAHGSHAQLGNASIENEKDTWTFFGNADEEVLKKRGRSLEVDYALAVLIDNGAAGRGSWKITIVNVDTGMATTERGSWNWGTAAPDIGRGMTEFFSKFMSNL